MGAFYDTIFGNIDFCRFMVYDEENCIVEMKVPQSWIGKSLSQLDLRKLYSINVLGKRDPKTHKLEVPVDPSAPIEMNDTFLVLGQTDKIEKYDYLL